MTTKKKAPKTLKDLTTGNTSLNKDQRAEFNLFVANLALLEQAQTDLRDGIPQWTQLLALGKGKSKLITLDETTEENLKLALRRAKRLTAKPDKPDKPAEPKASNQAKK